MRTPAVAIVDDDPAVGIALTRLIRSLGYRPALFGSAEDLIGSLDRSVVECVVTDLQMPGMSGLDLLRKLKALRPDLPVIVVTAYPSRPTRERALASGAFAYLPKPFDADEFERCLAAVLGERRM